MLNHGLYTDTLWSVPVTFVDAAGAAINLSGFEYVAEVVQNGNTVFAFRSTGAAADEGTISTTDAATGKLTLVATEAGHASVDAGLYRVHLFRDLADDVWTASGTLLIGDPGDRETYLKMDGNRTRAVNAAVHLPIVIIGEGTGSDTFALDGGAATTNFTGLPAFDFGSADGTAGGAIDLGSAT